MSPVPARACPVCTGEIRPDAIVCWHCGVDLRTGEPIPQTEKTNAYAIVSLVLGIVPIFGVGAIVGVVFGHMALRQIGASNGTESGRGLAIAGLVLGYLWIALYVLMVVAIVVFIIVYEQSLPIDGVVTT